MNKEKDAKRNKRSFDNMKGIICSNKTPTRQFSRSAIALCFNGQIIV